MAESHKRIIRRITRRFGHFPSKTYSNCILSSPTSDATRVFYVVIFPSSACMKKSKFDFFADPAQAAAGNIFKRRSDYSAFNALPRYQQNPYHIKLEDEGPHGNDEIRSFLLSNLSIYEVTSAHCVVCNLEMNIYDRYPLIDGTFFLSPMRYNSDVQVMHEGRVQYLNAACRRRIGLSTWATSLVV